MKRLSWLFLAACAGSSTDEAPRLEGALEERTTEDGRIAITWLNVVAAGDASELTVAAVSTLKGSVQATDNGRIVFDPAAQFEALNEGQEERVTVSLTVKDGKERVSPEYQFTVVVTGVNDAPTAPALNLTVSEDAAGSVTLPATADIDDLATTLTAHFDDGFVGASSLADGVYSFDPLDQFQGLAQGTNGSTTIRYTTIDSHMAESITQGEIVVTITGVNDAPVAVNDSFNASDMQETRLDVLANDHDIDVGDTLQLASVSGDHVSVDGNDVVFASGVSPGMYSFSYTVADSHGAMATAMASVTVVAACVASITSADATYVGGQPAIEIVWSSANCTSCSVFNIGTPITGASGVTNVSPTGVPTLVCTGALGEVSVQVDPFTYAPAWFAAPSGTSDGTSWDNAASIEDAAASAQASGGNLWLKEGSYPLTGTIALTRAVSLYGGFDDALTGQSGDLGDRAGVTTLSGTARLLEYTFPPAAFVIDGVSLTGASVTGDNDCGIGMNITSTAAVTLRNVHFSNLECTATGDLVGGALSLQVVSAPATLQGCTFSNNRLETTSANAQVRGGAAYVSGAPVSVSDSLFEDNAGIAAATGSNAIGGGLYVVAAQSDLDHVSFNSNNVTGAVMANGGGYAVVTGVTGYCEPCFFTANTAVAGNTGRGGAFFNATEMHIDGSDFTNNTVTGPFGVGAFQASGTVIGTYTATGNLP